MIDGEEDDSKNALSRSRRPRAGDRAVNPRRHHTLSSLPSFIMPLLEEPPEAREVPKEGGDVTSSPGSCTARRVQPSQHPRTSTGEGRSLRWRRLEAIDPTLRRLDLGSTRQGSSCVVGVACGGGGVTPQIFNYRHYR
jgi:hypothetical protein